MSSWRPYVDDPLFTAELILGHKALPADQEKRLIDYFEALIASRRVVHTAVAFNAIYFGYDLEYGGYSGGPVDFDWFPEANPASGLWPVGAMVNLATGSAPLYGEILYKEGAHQALGPDGAVPSWLSGAPPGATGPAEADGTAMWAERLVIDFDAFGQGLIVTRERLDRLRRRGRLLDPLGHLLSSSEPETGSPGQAIGSSGGGIESPWPQSCERFIRYLLGPARASLLRGPLPLLLGPDADDTDLQAGVRGALHTINIVLSLTPGLRRWGPYAFSRTEFAARLADTGPLGGGDLRMIANSLTRPPAEHRRYQPAETTRYTAVGPWLRDLASPAQLEGVAYSAAVCQANTVVSDVARREADDHGILPSGGHLRLDDPRQGGGIWRCSFPAGPYAQTDPLIPLGLGWLETLPPIPDDSLITEPAIDEQLTVTDSQVSWTMPLRLWHIRKGLAPLSERLTDQLARSLRLRLTHDGYDLDPDEADQKVTVERTGRGLWLSGIAWPLEFFPGILLHFWWPRGAPTLNAASTLLEVPERVDGELLEHRYDPSIITRDRAPGCARTGVRPLGLRERILRAVRRAGIILPDGTAVLPEPALVHGVFGSTTDNETRTALLTGPLAELIAEGRVSRETADRIPGRTWSRSASPLGRTGYVLVWRPKAVLVSQKGGAESAGGSTSARSLRSHAVQSFLRRLPPDQHATEGARSEYRKISERFGFGSELPSGYTLVRAHRRGGAT
jgi:hypothetical protein